MPGDLLDLILIVLAAAFAVAGYRQGFIVGVLSCIGFLAGAAVGAAFSPGVAKFFVHGSSQQALVAIILVFIAAMIGQLLASLLGVVARSRVTWRPVAMVDALGGAGVSVVSVLLIAWFIGSAVVNAPFPAVARQVRSSEVLRGVNDFIPPPALTMFSDFRQLLDKSPYTQVFGALGINGSANVPAPDKAVLSWPAVTKDRDSDVKILYVPGLRAPALRFAATAARGSGAVVVGYPENGPFRAVAARVGSQWAANGPNIYRTGTVTREIYAVRATVEPGNSGGPLLEFPGST